MKKKRLAILLAAGALVLGSCGGGDSTVTSSDSEDITTSETDSTDSTDDPEITSSDPGETSSSTTIDPVENTWTDSEVSLMESYLFGHTLPFFDAEAYGVTYQLTTMSGYLAYIINDATSAIFDAYLEAQEVFFEDTTDKWSGLDAGLRLLEGNYEDRCYVQQQVALYDSSMNVLDGEDLSGTLIALFAAEEPITSWPGDEIGYYMAYYLSSWTDLTSVPAPSSDLDTGLYYDITVYISYDASWNIIYFIDVTVEGDFTGYAQDVLAADYIASGIAIFTGYDTYVSPDGSLLILISDFVDGYTDVYIYPNTAYEFDWPEDSVASALTALTGNDQATTLPAYEEEGAAYIVTDYADWGMVYVDIYGVDATSADAYAAILEANGFTKALYLYGEWYYVDPNQEYFVNAAYYEYYGCLEIYIMLASDSYLFDWDSAAAILDEYLAGFGVADGVTLPEPEFDWSFGIAYDFGTILNIDLYDIDENGDSTLHVDDYAAQLNASADWEYDEDNEWWVSGTCAVYLDEYDGATSIYAQSTTGTTGFWSLEPTFVAPEVIAL